MGIGIGGVFGPKPQIQLSSSRIIHHRVLRPPLQVALDGLTPFNSYLYADLQFVCKSYKELIHEPLFVDFSVRFYAQGSVIREQTQSHIAVFPVYPPELTKVTNPLRLFFDNVINYDEVRFNVTYDPASIPRNVEYIVSTQYRATPSFSIVHMIMRILLSVISLIILVLFHFFMGSRSFQPEQVLTVVLVILSLLDADALFYSLGLFVPSYFFVVWNALFSTWFEGYFRVYLIAIIEALRSDDVLSRPGKYGTYLILHFLVRVYHELSPSVKLLAYDSEAVTNHDFLFFAERWSDRLFLTWLLCTLVCSAVSPRLKRPRRLWMYLGLAAVYLFWHGLDVGLSRAHVMIADGSTHAGMTLAWRIGVPLMFLFFYWPSPAPREPLQLQSSSSFLRRLASG
jgi:hypothetical protein